MNKPKDSHTTTTSIKFEKSLWRKGIKVIAGVDEVGRGALAGPLVAAAVVWHPEITIWKESHPNRFELLSQVTDSKRLSIKKRETLYDFIVEHAMDYSVVEVSPEDIDKNGVGEANKKALREAATKIRNVEHVLVDHYRIFGFVTRRVTKPKEMPITKGDTLSISIASASIIAKVHRDRIMREIYHPQYPRYGFDTHVGYGTAKHIEAIKKYGLSPIHRKSFRIH